jgi:hypothetical protein
MLRAGLHPFEAKRKGWNNETQVLPTEGHKSIKTVYILWFTLVRREAFSSVLERELRVVW